MNVILNNNSSKKDVSRYIKEFNSKESITEECIEELLSNLVELGIDTYNFSIGANIAARTIDKSIIELLETYLAKFDRKSEKVEEDYDKAFAAYYLLTYYYRTYEKLEKYAYALNMYQSHFEAKADNYALAYQIKARYLRKHGEGKEAMMYDRRAVELLKAKNIDNIHIRITLAATVAIALENREDYISESDIKEALETTQNAIIQNSDYAKYRYLLAKLRIFYLLYKNDHNQLHGLDYSKEIIEAKKLLRDAVELEDPKADAYPTSVIEYRSYMRAADLVLSELKLTERIKGMEVSQNVLIHQLFESSRTEVDSNLRTNKAEISEQLKTTQSEVDTKIEDIKGDFHTSLTTTTTSFEALLKQSQDHYLEILGVFVSIVAVIMVVIGTYSAKLTITAILVATFGMSVAMIGVYAAFLILLRDKIDKRYVIILLLSFIIEIIIITVSICWPSIRTFLAI